MGAENKALSTEPLSLISRILKAIRSRPFYWYLRNPAYRYDRRVQSRLVQETRGHIASGPFKGIRYFNWSGYSATIGYLPKLVGTYEKEVAAAIDEIYLKRYRTVIDIGSAEGLYAVSFAKRLPSAKVICYEMDNEIQKSLERLAEVNEIRQKLHIRGFCSPESLRKVLNEEESPILIKCDVEGAEADLLNPDLIERLKYCDLLVELHEMFRPGIVDLIRGRFSATHDITEYSQADRTIHDWPSSLSSFDGDDEKRLYCLREHRGGVPMNWFWMRSRYGS